MLSDITSTTLATVGSASTDVLVACVLCLALCIWAFVQGREVLIALVFALYPAMLLTIHFPYHYVTYSQETHVRLGVFGASLALAFVVIRRKLAHTFFIGGAWRWVEIVLLSMAVTGLIAAALYHAVDLGRIYAFSSLFDTLFLAPDAHFAWLLGTLTIIPFVVRY